MPTSNPVTGHDLECVCDECEAALAPAAEGLVERLLEEADALDDRGKLRTAGMLREAATALQAAREDLREYADNTQRLQGEVVELADRDAWRNECSRLTSEFQAERERLRRALEKADLAIEYQFRGQSDWTLEKATRLLNEASDTVKEVLASGSAAEEIWTCPNCGKEWPLAPGWQGGFAGCWTCQGSPRLRLGR